jgi:hypothetical protein
VTAPALDFGTDDDRYLAELAELVAIPTVLRRQLAAEGTLR